MKKITKAFALFALLAICITACKKDEKTTAEKIQGVWKAHSTITHYFIQNVHMYDTTLAPVGTTFEFTKDGKVISTQDNETDTVNYSLVGDTKITIDDETFDIKTLNSSTFELYEKEVEGNDYGEVTLKLVR